LLPGLCGFGNIRRIFDNPPIKRRVVNLNATLSHNLFQIPVGNGLADIEKHRVQDYVFRIVAAFEINTHTWGVLPVAF